MKIPRLFHHPMLWLVFGLPAASMVAGIGLVVAAVRSGGGDVAIDQVQRMAQVQMTELGPDQRATALHLSAVLQVQDGGLEVFPASGDFARDQALTLRLVHPSDGALDRTEQLLPSALGWQVPGEFANDHDWLLQLAPADGQWRVHGRLGARQQAAHLRPALSSD